MGTRSVRSFGVVVVAAFVVAVGFGCDYGQQYTASRVYAEPTFTGSAGELFLAYGKARTGGTPLDDQVVRVTGEVYLKTEDEAQLPALVLTTGESNRSQRIGERAFVRCVFHDRFRDEARTVQLGQTVTLEGVVMGQEGDLLLRECHFPISPEDTTVEKEAVYASGE